MRRDETRTLPASDPTNVIHINPIQSTQQPVITSNFITPVFKIFPCIQFILEFTSLSQRKQRGQYNPGKSVTSTLPQLSTAVCSIKSCDVMDFTLRPPTLVQSKLLLKHSSPEARKHPKGTGSKFSRHSATTRTCVHRPHAANEGHRLQSFIIIHTQRPVPKGKRQIHFAVLSTWEVELKCPVGHLRHGPRTPATRRDSDRSIH